MPDRYVNAAVSSSGTGDSWAQAYKTIKEATDAAAAGEPIYFATGTDDVITTDTTYTLAAGVRVISTSDTTNEPPTTYATGATVSSTTAGVDVFLSGVGALYGVTFNLGTGTTTNIIYLAYGDASLLDCVDCRFVLSGASAASAIWFGQSAGNESVLNCTRCEFSWTHIGEGISLNACSARLIDCDMSAGSTHPSVLVEVVNRAGTIDFIGCDLSDISTVVAATSIQTSDITLRQCLLKSEATIYAPSTPGMGQVYVFDCASGDQHYFMGHYTYLGTTLVTTDYYANDNICDVDLSWKVSGNANTTKASPYVSPWIHKWHDGTTAITPYLEALRVDSTTMYDRDQVWLEVTAKVTSGSTRVTWHTNRLDALTSGTDNASSTKAFGDWTGSPTATDSGDSTLKLTLASSITPAESGHIGARVGVAGNFTVYVDPTIRT
jgi:hypothetical protein